VSSLVGFSRTIFSVFSGFSWEREREEKGDRSCDETSRAKGEESPRI